MWRWRWLSSSSSYATHLVAFFFYMSGYIHQCGCQLEFTTSILEWGYILLSLSSFCVLSVLFLIDVVGVFFLYMSPSWEKKKQKKEMNTSRLAHISISIFRHCRSLLFSVDAASYFLVGRHRLSFFVCPRQRVQEKHKKTRERERDYPFLSLCLSSSRILE